MKGDDQAAALATEDAAAKKKRRPKKKKAKDKDGEGQEPDEAEDVKAEGGGGNGGGGGAAGREDFNIEAADWVDITAECQMAIDGMDVGEMIESPTFRLIDAMSAIEIMDPKMDSGFSTGEQDMTPERAAEVGIIASKLAHEELVSIMDQLLMHYLLWLEGHTIVQTIFCCLYLQDLEKYVKPIPYFCTFVDALLVACRQARSIILKAGVFDDEDFLPSLFNVDLEKCVGSAQPSEVWKQVQQDCKTLNKDSAALGKAAATRLEFMGKYMMSLTELEGSLPKRNMQSAQDGLTKCLGLIEKMGKDAKTPSAEILKCFDPSVNRRLLVPGPPRTVEHISDPAVVLGMWTSHVQELLLCFSIPKKPLEQLLEGAITHEGEPKVLPRSCAQLRVSEGGFLKKLLLESLELSLFPPEAMQHCKKSADAFVEHTESLLAHLLKLAHANRARKFRRLAHVFAELNVLQHEAWQLDEELQKTFGANLRYARPCWVWIMEHCLEAMLSKLFLGFELELYDVAEFHMIYWYSDYLYGLRVYNLNELHHAREQSAWMSDKKGRKPAARGQPNNKSGNKTTKFVPALVLLEAEQSAVRGLFRLLAYCLREALVKVPGPVTEGLAQRFILRFRSLEHFRLPHLPSFEDFMKSSASAQAPVESRVVLDAAQASFAEAKAHLDRLEASKEKDSEAAVERGKALKRVVVVNQVATSRLVQALVAGKKLPIKVEPTHHPHLVSVQVQPEATAKPKA